MEYPHLTLLLKSRFVAFLYEEGLSSATVKNYLAAVRHAQIALGLGDPNISSMPWLEYVLKGFKRSVGCAPRCCRLPITPDILRHLKRVWQALLNHADASMLWAASMICFCGFLRSGEVVVPSQAGYDPSAHLSFGDVLVDNTVDPHFIEVQIKASKTDPFRKGVSVYLGRTCSDRCPVAASLAWSVVQVFRWLLPHEEPLCSCHSISR